MDAAPDFELDVESLRAQLQSRTGQPVALLRTHISWVLLTQRLAFKLKKPVRLPFLDFSSAARRAQACLDELRLNRRLAPALYLGVVPVRGTPAAPRWGGEGPVIDHAVAMRRFADDALMSERLRRGQLSARAIECLALRLADFHAAAPAAGPDGPFGQPVQVQQSVRRVLEQLEAARPGDARLAPLRAWCEARLRALEPELRHRLESGAVREGHGDLHLANLIAPGGDEEATAFDCIEFDPALRWIDTLCDIGFATMDLQARGRRDLAFRFLDAYLQRGGDYDGTRVLRLYEVYRALVRALVQALSPGPAAGPDYLACAQALVEAGAAPRLLITCGPSGSGKSTVAEALLAQAGAVRIRSDVERKRLFGLRALQRSAEHGLDLYTPEAGRRTFEHLAACARAALLGGYPAIVDAAFLSRATRQDFEQLAWQLGVPFTILACTADAETLRRRVSARGAAGNDPSEAGVDVLEKQLETGEPLDAAERAGAIEVDTTGEVDVGALARRWLAAG